MRTVLVSTAAAVGLLCAVGVATADNFGPDAFGYRATDNVGGGGPAFAGFDITTSGRLVADGDDNSSINSAIMMPVPLGAPFSFYGTVYPELVPATNGYISTDLTDSGGDLSNDWPLPAAPSTGGGGRFYPLHDDLVSSTGDQGGVFYEYFPTSPVLNWRTGTAMGASIFQWRTRHYGTTAMFDVWTVLYDNGDMLVEVGPGNPELGSGSTTGIMDPTYTIALGIHGNTAGSIPDSYAVHIWVPEPATLSLLALGGLALIRRR